jgi:outer membrane protein assembly factor BamE (lipoprotein component of BamABCDE complex)
VKQISKFLFIALLAAGCMTAPYHKKQVQDESGDRLTVGKVQREIKVGMSSADVAEILGSPNVVTTDDQRREVWVYDKVASDVTYCGYGRRFRFGIIHSEDLDRSDQV